MAQWIAFLLFFSALLAFVDKDLAKARQRAIWQQSFQSEVRLRDVGRAWTAEWWREARIAGVSVRNAILVSAFMGILVAAFLSIGVEQPALAPFAGGAVGFWWFRVKSLHGAYEKYQQQMTTAILDEAIPIAVHSLKATGRLEVAVDEVAKLAKRKAVRALFGEVSETWRQKSLTPAEALVRAARERDVEVLLTLATMTRDAADFQPDYAEMWLGYREQMLQILYHQRRVAARTRVSKRNASIFVYLVGSLLLLAYPRMGRFLTFQTRVGFWLLLLVMVGGMVLIYRMAAKALKEV
ncbi:hypothetical protein [Alicyclobacillus tolerans]|uniref:Type II secretion system protein GspF domain-containing protein n=2 Tax=Alicyclobacillus tolerans TaxID=90970 RepID=A0ABT9LVH3_9BACL|nr:MULTISPECIES: hypothetical protein [Alicyclobacillus]MDP9728272.1 hypothetical protein [Alicyclobacillus tengchongensis]SHK94487.1 tight adherence protein B [Alicyclobacillus montanus]